MATTSMRRCKRTRSSYGAILCLVAIQDEVNSNILYERMKGQIHTKGTPRQQYLRAWRMTYWSSQSRRPFGLSLHHRTSLLYAAPRRLTDEACRSMDF